MVQIMIRLTKVRQGKQPSVCSDTRELSFPLGTLNVPRDSNLEITGERSATVAMALTNTTNFQTPISKF